MALIALARLPISASTHTPGQTLKSHLNERREYASTGMNTFTRSRCLGQCRCCCFDRVNRLLGLSTFEKPMRVEKGGSLPL